MRLLTGSEIAVIDAGANREYGIPTMLLMENAGSAVARAALEMTNGANKAEIVIFAGGGNNGGDAFVAARHLHNVGANVRLFLLSTPEKLKGDARLNWDIVKALQIRTQVVKEEHDVRMAKVALLNCNLIIDGIFGTGFHGTATGLVSEIISVINNSDIQVLAVDIPSAVDATTGQVEGEAVKAKHTVTFGWPKCGLVLPPGVYHAGELTVCDIGLPKELLANINSDIEYIDAGFCRHWLPQRSPESHKGNYGHALIVGGSGNMFGAPVLAVGGALRSGAGLVTAAVPKPAATALASLYPEAMNCPQSDAINRLGGKTIVLGMGLGRTDAAQALVRQILAKLDRTAVVDADALWHFVNLKRNDMAKVPLILTPHAGEMARLMQISVEDVQKDRLSIAKAAAKHYDAIVVLKGAGTIVACPDGKLFINSTGNAGMATGGSGDVLAGIIGGLLAQNLPPAVAAAIAVYVHGLAGDQAAAVLSQEGMIARDILYYLPKALAELHYL